jgi:hypothetical protein
VGGASGRVIPGVVALELVLAHTERLAVYLPELLVYPVGVVLRLLLVRREPLSPGLVSSPGTWRFGVQFSDGRKATSYGLGITTPGAGATVVGTTRRAITASANPENSRAQRRRNQMAGRILVVAIAAVG